MEGFAVDAPALPGRHTCGSTLDEALANAREAIELVILTLKDRGGPASADTENQVVRAEVAA